MRCSILSVDRRDLSGAHRYLGANGNVIPRNEGSGSAFVTMTQAQPSDVPIQICHSECNEESPGEAGIPQERTHSTASIAGAQDDGIGQDCFGVPLVSPRSFLVLSLTLVHFVRMAGHRPVARSHRQATTRFPRTLPVPPHGKSAFCTLGASHKCPLPLALTLLVVALSLCKNAHAIPTHLRGSILSGTH